MARKTRTVSRQQEKAEGCSTVQREENNDKRAISKREIDAIKARIGSIPKSYVYDRESVRVLIQQDLPRLMNLFPFEV